MHHQTAWQMKGGGRTFRAKFMWGDVPDKCMRIKCFLKLPGESGKSITYLMFESPTVLHLPATSGIDTGCRHWTSVRLIGLKGVVVAGLPVWMPVQCDCSYCRQPEPKLQSRVLRTIYWATHGRISGHMYSLVWIRRKQTARGWPCHTQGTVWAVRIYAWEQTQMDDFTHLFFTLFMGLWGRMEKKAIQNLEETS